jgi:phosphatidylinositol glycan class K
MTMRRLSLLLFSLSTCLAIGPSNHTSNHAVILSASRFWFNYRHANNALAIYKLIKQNGIPDENIILMLADDFPTNPRNPFKNAMYYEKAGKKPYSILDEFTQIDYRGDDVTVDNLRNVMLGKGGGDRVLHTDQDSNVLVYWTGHGGDTFFKFQDVEEIVAADIASIFQEMKFKSLLFLADTCQAFTLGNQITTPGVYMLGSSLKNENSYAHHSDSDLGLSVIERYTFQFVEFIKRQQGGVVSGLSLETAMVSHFDYRQQRAHVGVKRTTGTQPLSQVLLSDFFAAPPLDDGTTVGAELMDKPILLKEDWSHDLKAYASSS